MEITTTKKVYRVKDREYEIILSLLSNDTFRVSVHAKGGDHKTGSLTVKKMQLGSHQLIFELNKKLYKARVCACGQAVSVCLCNTRTQFQVDPVQTVIPASVFKPAAAIFNQPSPVSKPVRIDIEPELRAPLAGKIIKILAKSNESVTINQPLVIIESMKMENEICAPSDAIIKTLHVSTGDLVNVGQVLVVFEKKGETHATPKDGQKDAADR